LEVPARSGLVPRGWPGADRASTHGSVAEHRGGLPGALLDAESLAASTVGHAGRTAVTVVSGHGALGAIVLGWGSRGDWRSLGDRGDAPAREAVVHAGRGGDGSRHDAAGQQP